MVCKLKKTIYGLKQEPQGWYEKNRLLFERSRVTTRFQQGIRDHNLYSRLYNDRLILIPLYIDDHLLVVAHIT